MAVRGERESAEGAKNYQQRKHLSNCERQGPSIHNKRIGIELLLN
jgi:hypothetical protein